MKRFYIRNNIGKAKYTVNPCDGIEKHADGSDFFGIIIFKNKKKRDKCVKDLLKQGYTQIP